MACAMGLGIEGYDQQKDVVQRWWFGTTHKSEKELFLQLAANINLYVAQKRDSDGVLLTRKAMVMCRMALNLIGIWEERQLSPDL